MQFLNTPSSEDFVQFLGIGLHRGQASTVTIRRGEPGSGLCFRTKQIWRASFRRVLNTQYRVVLSDEEQCIQTVEHLLSALYGLGISDVLIEVDGGEIPILDGSAFPLAEKLIEAGFTKHPRTWESYTPPATVSYRNPKTGAKIIYHPGTCLQIRYHLMAKGRKLISAKYTHSPASYLSDIAPARTFAFLSELKKIKNQKLISGIRTDCGFIVMDTPPDINKITQILGFRIPLEWFYAAEPYPVISHEPPRFADEAVRHKILDMLGDFALSGKYLTGVIEAWGTGHSDHIAFLRQLKLPAP